MTKQSDNDSSSPIIDKKEKEGENEFETLTKIINYGIEQLNKEMKRAKDAFRSNFLSGKIFVLEWVIGQMIMVKQEPHPYVRLNLI